MEIVNANAFASTFPFFPLHKARQKNVKELASQHTGHSRRKTEKNNEPLTAPWQKSGFSGYINSCASNKFLWWLDSFVLLSPLLRQAAKR